MNEWMSANDDNAQNLFIQSDEITGLPASYNFIRNWITFICLFTYFPCLFSFNLFHWTNKKQKKNWFVKEMEKEKRKNGMIKEIIS